MNDIDKLIMDELKVIREQISCVRIEVARLKLMAACFGSGAAVVINIVIMVIGKFF